MSVRRPPSIRWFERIVYLNQLVAIASTYAAWEAIREIADPSFAPPRFMFYLLAVVIAVNLLLMWLIAYRASNVARWILVVLIGLSFWSLANIPAFLRFGHTYFALALLQYLLSAVSVWLLFRRDARRWFAGHRPVDPEVFR